MSYILKALEELEKNAPKTEPPGLQKEPGQPAARPRRSRFLPHLLVAALLINAGIFLWWLHPWEKSKPPAVVPAAPLPQASSAPPVLGRQAEEETHGRGEDHTRAAAGGVSEVRENSGPVPAEAAKGSGRKAGEERKVYNMSDLPPSVRQDLPDIAISGHSYSPDPSSRIVLINGSTMREGQDITGGLRLEQITPDGVILSYQGYRLRKGVF